MNQNQLETVCVDNGHDWESFCVLDSESVSGKKIPYIMNSGTLDIRITSPTTLQMVSQTGGFSATTWQKVR